MSGRLSEKGGGGELWREGREWWAERRFDGGDRSVIDLTTGVRCCVEVYRRLFGLLYDFMWPCAWQRGSEARRRSTRKRALTFLAGASLYLHADNIMNTAINPTKSRNSNCLTDSTCCNFPYHPLFINRISSSPPAVFTLSSLEIIRDFHRGTTRFEHK